MNYTEIMVRYGELSTKGKNKKRFISMLAANVKNALTSYPLVKVHANRDRMNLLLNGENSQEVMACLSPIFGIQNYSPAIKVEKEMAVIYETAIQMVKENFTEGQSFKVNARRSDHLFELDTNELNREVGHHVIQAIPTIKVQMKQPDITLRVESRDDGAFLSC